MKELLSLNRYSVINAGMWIKSQSPWFRAIDNSWTAIHFRMSCNPLFVNKAKIGIEVVGVIDGKTQKSTG